MNEIYELYFVAFFPALIIIDIKIKPVHTSKLLQTRIVPVVRCDVHNVNQASIKIDQHEKTFDLESSTRAITFWIESVMNFVADLERSVFI